MPRPSPSFDSFRKHLEGLSYVLDETVKFNVNTKISIKCPYGHEYYTSITKITSLKKNPHICPHCTKEEKLSKYKIDIKLIKEYFINSSWTVKNEKVFLSRWLDTIQLECIHDKSQHTIKSIDYWLKNKYIPACDECQKDLILKRKKNLIDNVFNKTTINPPNVEFKNEVDINILPTSFKNKYTDQNNWILFEFKNTKSKCKFQCKKCGSIKETLPFNLFDKGLGCVDCKKNDMRENVLNKLRQMCINNNVDLLNDTPYTGIDNPIKFKCNSCNTEFEKLWTRINSEVGLNTLTCPSCFKSTKRSSENGFSEYIKSLVGDSDVDQNNTELIKPYEIDCLVKSKNIAFEYCGTIWHSEKYDKDKEYHRRKYELCKSKNIRLITIFDDEWIDSPDICKSRIQNILGIKTTTLFARKCFSKQIPNKVAFKFLKDNHIQGRGHSHVAYGLYHNYEFMSVMTFSKPSVSKNANKYDWELNRFCSLTGYNIVGGASKLLKSFSREHNGIKLVTFCDLRWGNGGVYEKIGFKYLYTTNPNYYYVGNYTKWKRKHRYNFTKSRLLKIFGVEHKDKTEYQIALDNGLYRVWDCGHKKYEIVF
jgi:hypothetical protein